MTNTQDKQIYKGKFYLGIHQETYYSRAEIKDRLTDNYIRGLIEGEGCFYSDRRQNGEEIPAFVLKMHVRDKELIESIRDYLEIDNRVYEYKHQGRHFAMLIVRDTWTLKNKIIPICKRKLLGFKGTQFEWWLKHFPHLNSLQYRS